MLYLITDDVAGRLDPASKLLDGDGLEDLLAGLAPDADPDQMGKRSGSTSTSSAASGNWDGRAHADLQMERRHPHADLNAATSPTSPPTSSTWPPEQARARRVPAAWIPIRTMPSFDQVRLSLLRPRDEAFVSDVPPVDRR